MQSAIEGAAVRIVLNGLDRTVPDGCTIAELLRLEREPVEHVLVEVNGEAWPSKRHGERPLAEGDRVEIIHPAFGG